MLERAPSGRLKTPITDLFAIDIPIIAGGLMWLADADYVAACARAGIIGFITAASFKDDLAALRDEIRKCRDLSQGRSFGVNVSMLPKLVEGERTMEVFELIAAEGVRFVETSGRSPEPFMPVLKEAGITVIHKAPAVRYALKAQSLGVDAVAIVGAECGGHPGLDMIGTFVQTAIAGERLSIPFIVGGGVGCGSQLVAALAMGASGVVIGIRFVVAEEIWAHRAVKEAMVKASERDTALVLHTLRNTLRALANDTTAEVARLESRDPPPTLDELMPLITGSLARKAYETGEWKEGLLSAGQALAFADRIEPIADIVARIASEARESLARLETVNG